MAAHTRGPTSMLFVLTRTTTAGFGVTRRLSISPKFDLGTKPTPFQDVDDLLREGIVRLLAKYNNNEPDAAKHIWGLSGCYFPRDQSVTVVLDHLPSARGMALSSGDKSQVWQSPIVLMLYVPTSTPSVFRFAQQVTVAPAYHPAGHLLTFNYVNQHMYQLVQDRIEILSSLSDDPMRKPWATLSIKRSSGITSGSLLFFLEYQPDVAALDPMSLSTTSRAPSIRIDEIESIAPITEQLPSYTRSQAQLDTI